MHKKEDLVSLEAKHGEKMIEIKVRFWTNEKSRCQTPVKNRERR